MSLLAVLRRPCNIGESNLGLLRLASLLSFLLAPLPSFSLDSLVGQNSLSVPPKSMIPQKSVLDLSLPAPGVLPFTTHLPTDGPEMCQHSLCSILLSLKHLAYWGEEQPYIGPRSPSLSLDCSPSAQRSASSASWQGCLVLD